MRSTIVHDLKEQTPLVSTNAVHPINIPSLLSARTKKHQERRKGKETPFSERMLKERP